MLSWLQSHKLITGICGLVIVIVLSYIDWNKDPNKWAQGYWHEQNLQMYAHVTPGTARVVFKNGQSRSFHYEIKTNEDPFPFEVWQGERKWGDIFSGVADFKSKNEVKLRSREQKSDPMDPLTSYAAGYSMTWHRIEESQMPVQDSGKRP